MKVLWLCNIMLPRIAEELGMPKSNKEGWLTGISETILANKENKIFSKFIDIYNGFVI